MPVDYRSELIAVYARVLVAAVRADEAYQALCRAHERVPSFQLERVRIENAKTRIEATLERELTQREVVKAALELLIRTRPEPATMSLYRDIIGAGYRPGWSSEQQSYFDAAWCKIRREHDFFLSFTTRLPTGTVGLNPVNEEYRALISGVLGRDRVRGADQRRENLLALAVHDLLRKGFVSGFFYLHHVNDNSETERKLIEACDESAVFVQLVQPVMFVPAAGTNYCFFEWQRMLGREDGDRHFLYLVAEPDRETFLQLRPFPEYDEWHDHVRSRDALYIPSQRRTAEVDAFRRLFRTKIVSEIRDVWSRLADGVP